MAVLPRSERTDIVVLNKGLRDGLEVGHVLAVYQTGELVFDKVAQGNVRLPDVRAGLAMVFESFDKASYALVLKVQSATQGAGQGQEPIV